MGALASGSGVGKVSGPGYCMVSTICISWGGAESIFLNLFDERERIMFCGAGLREARGFPPPAMDL